MFPSAKVVYTQNLTTEWPLTDMLTENSVEMAVHIMPLYRAFLLIGTSKLILVDRSLVLTIFETCRREGVF